jgi:hypothetical protein
MNTFQEYQTVAAKVPISLRNNRDQVLLPVSGLQQEAGIGLQTVADHSISQLHARAGELDPDRR